MDFRIFDLIANVSSLSMLIPLALFILTVIKKNTPYAVKVLGVFLFVSGLSDLLSTVLIEYKINPNPVISAYVILQFVLFSLIYRNAFNKITYKRITVIVIFGFLIFAAYNLLLIQGIVGFNSNSFAVSSVVFIVYAFAYFHRLIIELPALHVHRLFMLWFNAAIVLYFGCNLFIFASIGKLINDHNDQLLLSWAFHNVFNIIKNLVFTMALYVVWKYGNATGKE